MPRFSNHRWRAGISGSCAQIFKIAAPLRIWSWPPACTQRLPGPNRVGPTFLPKRHRPLHGRPTDAPGAGPRRGPRQTSRSRGGRSSSARAALGGIRLGVSEMARRRSRACGMCRGPNKYTGNRAILVRSTAGLETPHPTDGNMGIHADRFMAGHQSPTSRHPIGGDHSIPRTFQWRDIGLGTEDIRLRETFASRGVMYGGTSVLK